MLSISVFADLHLYGRVRGDSNEAIGGAVVRLKNLSREQLTNQFGYFAWVAASSSLGGSSSSSSQMQRSSSWNDDEESSSSRRSSSSRTSSVVNDPEAFQIVFHDRTGQLELNLPQKEMVVLEAYDLKGKGVNLYRSSRQGRLCISVLEHSFFEHRSGYAILRVRIGGRSEAFQLRLHEGKLIAVNYRVSEIKSIDLIEASPIAVSQVSPGAMQETMIVSAAGYQSATVAITNYSAGDLGAIYLQSNPKLQDARKPAIINIVCDPRIYSNVRYYSHRGSLTSQPFEGDSINVQLGTNRLPVNVLIDSITLNGVKIGTTSAAASSLPGGSSTLEIHTHQVVFNGDSVTITPAFDVERVNVKILDRSIGVATRLSTLPLKVAKNAQIQFYFSTRAGFVVEGLESPLPWIADKDTTIDWQVVPVDSLDFTFHIGNDINLWFWKGPLKGDTTVHVPSGYRLDFQFTIPPGHKFIVLERNGVPTSLDQFCSRNGSSFTSYGCMINTSRDTDVRIETEKADTSYWVHIPPLVSGELYDYGAKLPEYLLVPESMGIKPKYSGLYSSMDLVGVDPDDFYQALLSGSIWYPKTDTTIRLSFVDRNQILHFKNMQAGDRVEVVTEYVYRVLPSGQDTAQIPRIFNATQAVNLRYSRPGFRLIGYTLCGTKNYVIPSVGAYLYFTPACEDPEWEGLFEPSADSIALSLAPGFPSDGELAYFPLKIPGDDDNRFTITIFHKTKVARNVKLGNMICYPYSYQGNYTCMSTSREKMGLPVNATAAEVSYEMYTPKTLTVDGPKSLVESVIRRRMQMNVITLDTLHRGTLLREGDGITLNLSPYDFEQFHGVYPEYVQFGSAKVMIESSTQINASWVVNLAEAGLSDGDQLSISIHGRKVPKYVRWIDGDSILNFPKNEAVVMPFNALDRDVEILANGGAASRRLNILGKKYSYRPLNGSYLVDLDSLLHVDDQDTVEIILESEPEPTDPLPEYYMVDIQTSIPLYRAYKTSLKPQIPLAPYSRDSVTRQDTLIEFCISTHDDSLNTAVLVGYYSITTMAVNDGLVCRQYTGAFEPLQLRVMPRIVPAVDSRHLLPLALHSSIPGVTVHNNGVVLKTGDMRMEGSLDTIDLGSFQGDLMVNGKLYPWHSSKITISYPDPSPTDSLILSITLPPIATNLQIDPALLPYLKSASYEENNGRTFFSLYTGQLSTPLYSGINSGKINLLLNANVALSQDIKVNGYLMPTSLSGGEYVASGISGSFLQPNANGKTIIQGSIVPRIEVPIVVNTADPSMLKSWVILNNYNDSVSAPHSSFIGIPIASMYLHPADFIIVDSIGIHGNTVVRNPSSTFYITEWVRPSLLNQNGELEVMVYAHKARQFEIAIDPNAPSEITKWTWNGLVFGAPIISEFGYQYTNQFLCAVMPTSDAEWIETFTVNGVSFEPTYSDAAGSSCITMYSALVKQVTAYPQTQVIVSAKLGKALVPVQTTVSKGSEFIDRIQAQKLYQGMGGAVCVVPAAGKIVESIAVNGGGRIWADNMWNLDSTCFYVPKTDVTGEDANVEIYGRDLGMIAVYYASGDSARAMISLDSCNTSTSLLLGHELLVPELSRLSICNVATYSSWDILKWSQTTSQKLNGVNQVSFAWRPLTPLNYRGYDTRIELHMEY